MDIKGLTKSCWSGVCRLHPNMTYQTTTFTIFPGTTIIFLGDWPLRILCISALAKTSFSTSSFVNASESARLNFVFPFNEMGYANSDSTRYSSYNVWIDFLSSSFLFFYLTIQFLAFTNSISFCFISVVSLERFTISCSYK